MIKIDKHDECYVIHFYSHHADMTYVQRREQHTASENQMDHLENMIIALCEEVLKNDDSL